MSEEGLKIVRKEDLDEETLKLLVLSDSIENVSLYAYHPETYEYIGRIEGTKIGNIVVNKHIDDYVTLTSPNYDMINYSHRNYNWQHEDGNSTAVYDVKNDTWIKTKDYRNFKYKLNHEIEEHLNKMYYYLPLEGDEDKDDRREYDKLGDLPEGAVLRIDTKETLIKNIKSKNTDMYNSIWSDILQRIFKESKNTRLSESYNVPTSLYVGGAQKEDAHVIQVCTYVHDEFIHKMNILRDAIQYMELCEYSGRQPRASRVYAIMMALFLNDIDTLKEFLFNISGTISMIDSCYMYLNLINFSDLKYKELYILYNKMKDLNHEKYEEFYKDEIYPRVRKLCFTGSPSTVSC